MRTFGRRKLPNTIDPAYLNELRDVLQRGKDGHHTWLDAWAFNIATVIALAATSAATIIPSQTWARVAAAVATFLIATMRAMDLGGRWRFRWEMRMEYQILIDRTREIEILPDDQKATAIRRIYDQLEELHRRESGIPGTSEGLPTGGGPS